MVKHLFSADQLRNLKTTSSIFTAQKAPKYHDQNLLHIFQNGTGTDHETLNKKDKNKIKEILQCKIGLRKTQNHPFLDSFLAFWSV